MDRIEFWMASDGGVTVVINAKTLQERLSNAVHHLDSKRAQMIASDPAIPVRDIPLPGHFYNETDVRWAPLEEYEIDGDEDPILLSCSCGELGCSPTVANIAVSDSIVIWSNFRYSNQVGEIGPFRFGRNQYDAALQELMATADRYR